MDVREGEACDLEKLHWAWEHSPKTKKIFCERIIRGIQDFLVIYDADADDEKILWGEIHILWDSEDKDEANGETRAYLLTFRIHPDLQGKGFGSKLITKALSQVKSLDYHEVTVGVRQDIYQAKQMYSHWGFTILKHKEVDDHNFDIPVTKSLPPVELYIKQLKER